MNERQLLDSSSFIASAFIITFIGIFGAAGGISTVHFALLADAKSSLAFSR